MLPDRKKAEQAYTFGKIAELCAGIWLLACGYKILDRRYCVKGGEIDLVVQKGKMIVFIEVKARQSLDQAAMAITHLKQIRLSKAASIWVGRHPWAQEYTFRVDAIFLSPWSWPRHVQNAFSLKW